MIVEPEIARTGLWTRFCAWLGRMWRAFLAPFGEPEPMPVIPLSPAPAPPPPPPPGVLRGRRRLPSPLVVPANGYVFNFHVQATFVWAADGLYQDELTSSIDALMPYATRRLKALAARLSRLHSPHRAREFEAELQRELQQSGPWSLTWRGATLSCDPHVWVELDEHVKEAIRPYWEQIIKLDFEHDVQMRRAEYAERLSRQWTTILTDLMVSPVAGGAAEMTENELAEVVRKIVDEQRATAEKLEELMTRKVDGGDTFERTEHFDALLERLQHRADRLFQQADGAPANGHRQDGPTTRTL
ncbi:hypothetical protein [Actinoplanes xinjiangensis]|uniref:Uncharacterized protein n=1 Tax=Actinoplanes xinjiangensis TaxID=512350 RepID=A0A316FAM7_9ACTN|nr:hypothetical protein [Actinoplanes xinjiangensis]PWK42677.1 hypothetical protein BC793_114121 [Actinoplanes xinjiangensis]GIF38238.1 hypothetical protein Axi01nite_25490 [Actinoplanes xinjiangensis]